MRDCLNSQLETFHTDRYLIVHTCDGGLIIAQQVIGVIYQAAIFPFRKWNSRMPAIISTRSKFFSHHDVGATSTYFPLRLLSTLCTMLVFHIDGFHLHLYSRLFSLFIISYHSAQSCEKEIYCLLCPTVHIPTRS